MKHAKGRTSSGRIKKGYRLSESGRVVKARKDMKRRKKRRMRR